MTLEEHANMYKERIKSGATFKRVNAIDNLNTLREGVYCRCFMDPLWTPRHSDRYPWKDDDNEIREVFNMDSNRLNRFVTLLNAVGGSFCIEDSIGERPTARIDIPCDMLSHLYIDGSGSVDTFRTVNINIPMIPDIRNIQTFNDRVVLVTFIDGSQTKSVCGKDETFDLYEGIAFCLFKRFLGKGGHKGFNDIMRYAFKKLDEQEKAKEREVKIEAEKKQREEKKKLQAERRKDKKREEQIGIYQEAMKRNWEEITCNVLNPYIAPGEPEPPTEFDKKTIEEGK